MVFEGWTRLFTPWPAYETVKRRTPALSRATKTLRMLTRVKPARRQVLEREEDSLVHVRGDDHTKLAAPRSGAGNRRQPHFVKEVCPEQSVPQLCGIVA